MSRLPLLTSNGGDADGLAAAIRTKKVVADKRFRKSQSMAKLQKKRSKIERFSDRPADNIKVRKKHMIIAMYIMLQNGVVHCVLAAQITALITFCFWFCTSFLSE
jgi:hypothetical protein